MLRKFIMSRPVWMIRNLAGAFALVMLFLAGNSAVAADPRVVVLSVPTPLESESAKRIRAAAREAIEKFEAADRAKEPRERVVPRLILDFHPKLQPCVSEFGPAYDLAQSLRSLKSNHGVLIHGWIHGEVRSHAVLVALACDNLFFSKDSRLGRVLGEGTGAPTATLKAAYEEISRGRYPLAVVRKLYDRDLVVVRSRDPKAVDIFKEQFLEPQGEVVLPGGAEGWLDTPTARAVGFAQMESCETLDALAAVFHLPRQSLVQSQVRLEEARAIRIVLTGKVDLRLSERVKRRVSRAVGKGFNTIVFDLQCGNGDPDAALELANFIRELADPARQTPILTIAWVSPEARDLSLPLALACSRVLMHQGAHLGGLEGVIGVQAAVGRLQSFLEDLLQGKQFSKEESSLLARAWLDPSARLALGVPRTGGATLILDPAKIQNLADVKLELMLKPSKPEEENKTWVLSSGVAADPRINLANGVFTDLDSALNAEGIHPAGVPVSGTDWLDDLADFLSHPYTSVVLVMIGVTCLILEVKVPGASLPGVLASFCFVLFFWSNSQLAGQMLWLGVLLFVLGMVLILMEVFLIPGFGVTGISGILLILGSLGLVAYGHWPRSMDEWGQLARVVGPFAVSGIVSIILAMFLARYLPSLPVTHFLVLESTSGDEGTVPVTTIDGVRPEDLMGSLGSAVTPLHPAGKARIGQLWLDVVSDGGFINQGDKIRVIEVEGNRIVVKREV